MWHLGSILFWGVLAGANAAPAASSVLHHLSELQALSQQEAAQGVPCDLAATVTLYNPGLFQFFVQEGDAGAYVFQNSAMKLQPGDRVRIQGKSQQGGYAPVVVADRITRLGSPGLPEPVRPSSWSPIHNSDRFDNRFAEIEATVLSVAPLFMDGSEAEPGAHELKLAHKGETLQAMLIVAGGFDPSALVQSDVVVRGVITPSRMMHKQRHDGWIVVDSMNDVCVLRKHPLDWNRHPKIPLSGLLQFRGPKPPDGYFRTEGTVAWFDAVSAVTIEDGLSSIDVSRAWPEKLRQGTRYEVFGRLVRGERNYWHIEEGQFREIGPGEAAPTRAALPREVALGELPGELITVTVTLTQVLDRRGICVLHLQDKEFSLEAELPHSLGDCPTDLAPGSRVEVTGRLQQRWREGSRFPVETTMLMRSQSDVRVFSQPTVWTRLPFGKLLAALACLAALAMAWIWQLRRQVRVQISRIAEQNAELEKAKVKAEESSRLKSEFLANMSHEIRTPMNGVMGMTEILLDSEVTAQQRSDLLIVRSSAESLLTVLNDILDFSKIEAGKLALDPISFDLRATIENTVKSLTYLAQQKGLEVLCEIAPETPECVVGDPTRLRQILVNLLGNAVKFTERGEVGVHVSVEQTAGISTTLHFIVSDTGSGIPSAKHNAIFQAFTQADASTTRKHGGTGLGLTISSRLVAIMGGRIWLESQPGSGSRFHFTAQFGMAPSQTHQTPRPGIVLASLAGLNILVAEDNTVNQQLIRRLLEKRNHRVVIAGDGRDAVSAVEREDFDLIFMDVQMPGMDGLEATAAIRNIEKATGKHRQIFAMTAHAMNGDRERCLAAGMDGYIAKPIRPIELAEILDSVHATR